MSALHSVWVWASLHRRLHGTVTADIQRKVWAFCSKSKSLPLEPKDTPRRFPFSLHVPVSTG